MVPTASCKDRSPDGTDGLMKRTSSLCLFQLTALESSPKSRNDEWGLREAELLWKKQRCMQTKRSPWQGDYFLMSGL